jgi:putative ABC transport system ATP-binding protein
MGPSGSGKTTLLSIKGCILRATSGSVKVRGREVAHLPERELPRARWRISVRLSGLQSVPGR